MGVVDGTLDSSRCLMKVLGLRRTPLFYFKESHKCDTTEKILWDFPILPL